MNFAKRILIQIFLIFLSFFSFAQENKNSFEIYGFITTDAGYNFNSIDPNWFDVMRPTKLPKFQGEFAPDGNVFFSVRQTRFGVRNISNTKKGELKIQIDFDLMGFGSDTGQTTLHLINAFAQLGNWLVGRTASLFMDPDAYPVTLDYWGPMTRIYNFNTQVRYTFLNNEKQRLMLALERPGATADESPYSIGIELENVKPVFRLPNLTGNYRHVFGWGYVQLGGILKSMKWKDLTDSSQYHLSGSATGWGIDISTVVNVSSKIKLKFQGEYGHGIQSHIADAPPDLGLQSTHDGNPSQPFKGKALPVGGFFSFLEVKWNKKFQSSIGCSLENIENSDLQLPDAFRKGQYGLVNFRYYPIDNILMGVEYQYGRRYNFSDGFHSTANKVQFSFKFNFSNKLTTFKSDK
jgi:hypothetical protein